MIHEALSAILIRADKNSSFFKPFKRVWNCSLCFVSFLSVKHWTEGTYDGHAYKSVSKQKKCEHLHLFAPIACKYIMAKI